MSGAGRIVLLHDDAPPEIVPAEDIQIQMSGDYKLPEGNDLVRGIVDGTIIEMDLNYVPAFTPPVLRCRCGYAVPVIDMSRQPGGAVDVTYRAEEHPCSPRRVTRSVRAWARRVRRADRPSRGQRIHERRRKAAERRR